MVESLAIRGMRGHRALTEGRAVASSPPRAVAHVASKGPIADTGGALTAQTVLQILRHHTQAWMATPKSPFLSAVLD